nr:hypothetical protein [Tanacetum cinerariifolium]
APAARHGIGRAHHVGRKHHGRVELRDDERRTNDANGKAEKQKALVTVTQANKHNRQRAHRQQQRVSQPRADGVAELAHEQARQDGG